MKNEPIKIYTDGGCDKNPGGTGAWAFCILDGNRMIERSGQVANTTNNRMEMTAAIQALERLQKAADVELYSDSQYLIRGMNEWIHSWVKHDWKLKDGSPVKNVELWKKLHKLARKHGVKWIWVRGHADDTVNLRVDKLVREAMKGKVVLSESTKADAVSALPVVNVVRKQGKPVAVKIALKSSAAAKVDRPVEVKIDAVHLQKLVEDLIAVLRDLEES